MSGSDGSAMRMRSHRGEGDKFDDRPPYLSAWPYPRPFEAPR